jgi:hypothetical protein
LSIKEKGVVGVVRYIGMDVYREFAQLAVLRMDRCETGPDRGHAGSVASIGC